MTNTRRLRRGLALVGGLAVLILLLWPVNAGWHGFRGGSGTTHCGPAILASVGHHGDSYDTQRCNSSARNRVVIAAVVGGGLALVAWLLPGIVFTDDARYDNRLDTVAHDDTLPRV